MTELSFLIDLLLNHRLPPKTKEAVAARLREVELSYTLRPMAQGNVTPPPVPLDPTLAVQSPSTRALMLKHAHMPQTPQPAEPPPPPPVAIVAQTPATMAALASREAAIAAAISGKPEKGHVSPRKF